MSTQPTNNPPSDRPLYPDGFIAIRSGLVDHLQSGKMTAAMFPVYFVLLQQCDWTTGVWNGNAHRIYHALGGSMSLSEIRKQMAKLGRQLYIKSFHFQGRKGNYFVLVNRYKPTRGKLKGKVLNSTASTSWEHPVYEDGSDGDVTSVSQGSDARVRRVSEGSGTRPYQDVQDSQDALDVQEAQEIGGGGGGENQNISLMVSENQNPTPSGKDGVQELLSDLRTIYDYHNVGGWNTKPSDVERAFTLSEQYGRLTFLQAFDMWCYHDASDQIETKQFEPLKFPLVKFLGQVDYYATKSQDEIEVRRRSKTGSRTYACPIVREAACTETVQ